MAKLWCLYGETMEKPKMGMRPDSIEQGISGEDFLTF